MSATVWSRFFWADWLSDAGLRACSVAARGVWMDMLCVAASHDPVGYVAIKNRGLTPRDIARLTGEKIATVEQALKELETQNVFGRTKKGVIYSRRMLRDQIRAVTARKNGKLGGNPSLRKQTPNPNWDKGGDKGGVTPNGTRARASTCHKPEEKTSSSPPLPPKRGERARALPTNFHLEKADVQFATEQAWDPIRLQTEFARFCDHAQAKGRKAADWHAAWRMWVTDPLRSKSTNGGHNDGDVQKRGDVIAAADQLVADARARVEDERRKERGGD